MSANLENSAVATGLEKVSFHSKPKERQCQRMLKLLHNCTHLAKSLQSCPTLCNPTDGSPPGSPVPGILQARTLEWVAISFSNACKWKVKVKLLSHVRLWRPHGQSLAGFSLVSSQRVRHNWAIKQQKHTAVIASSVLTAKSFWGPKIRKSDAKCLTIYEQQITGLKLLISDLTKVPWIYL